VKSPRKTSALSMCISLVRSERESTILIVIRAVFPGLEEHEAVDGPASDIHSHIANNLKSFPPRLRCRLGKHFIFCEDGDR
jgi:hypothetical protein